MNEAATSMRAHSLLRPERRWLVPLLIACTMHPARAAADCSDPAQVFSTTTIFAGGNGAAIVAGDFNGDGRPDLASGGYGKLLIHMNGSLGAPFGIVVGTDPFGVTTGDFNEDGILDIATANTHSDDVSVLLGGHGGVGDGTFSAFGLLNAGRNPFAIATADLNGDGHLDLVVTNLGETSLTVWLGHGDGTFGVRTGFTTGNAPAGLAIADFSGDGKLDIAVANSGDAPGKVSVLRGFGDGTFQPRVNFNVGALPIEVAAADLNFDGRPDCVVSNQAAHTISILMTTTSGSFAAQVTYAVGSSPRGLAVADFNGDGMKDVAVSRQESGSVKLFLGRGGSSFAAPAIYVAGARPAGVVATDLNGDGAVDLAVVSIDSDYLSILLGLCSTTLPVVNTFSPIGGIVGDPVIIAGRNLGGATAVRFGGTAASFTVLTPASIQAMVPAGATTAPISVTTPFGTGTSNTSFYVGQRPVIDSASSDSGWIGGSITLRGQHFLNATHVRFGGTGEAIFTVISDVEITAAIDSSASTGTIRVTTPAATGASDFEFRVVLQNPFPRIVTVRDVPRDQGGFATVIWKPSDLDNSYVHRIIAYRVWRRLIGAEVARPPAAATARLGWRTGAFLDGWELLTTMPSAFLDGYACTAHTTEDSTAGGNPRTSFFVQALTADSLVFYSSPVDSGYSVDNLAPAQPGPFVGVYGPSAVALHWGASREADLLEYRLYRGPGPDFVPSEANLVLAGSDTGYVDHAAPPTYTYKLSAVDRHGNESRFAMVTPNGPTSTLASVVSVATDQGHVRIVWYTSGNSGVPVTIYRRPLGLIWESMTIASSDGTGKIQFDDADVVTGNTYEYRLGIFDGDAEVFAGEVTVTVTAAASQVSLALHGVQPNPALRDRVRVALTLPDGRAGTLALIDVSGRRVREREIGSLGAGNHVVDLGGERLAPGVYLLELRQGDQRVTAKAAVR
jgi:hypothetical protein